MPCHSELNLQFGRSAEIYDFLQPTPAVVPGQLLQVKSGKATGRLRRGEIMALRMSGMISCANGVCFDNIESEVIKRKLNESEFRRLELF